MTSADVTIATNRSDGLLQTDLPLPNRRQGKVRDIYDIPPTDDTPRRLLIVATDRISAFDVVLPTPIPGKGKVLTDISSRWFTFFRSMSLVKDHLISTDPADIPGLDDSQREMLDGRVMICKAAKVIPIECVARGYLAGSGWKEYEQTGKVCGVELPAGLVQSDQLPEVIFTPATKVEQGHDENISLERAGEIVGEQTMAKLSELTLTMYRTAAAYAEKHNIILADSKLEFGYELDEDGNPTDQLLLIDEIFTPDSSRFWPMDNYEPGRDQASYDKQFVRNYLLSLVEKKNWDKTPPGPELPEHIVHDTLQRYVQARESLFSENAPQ